MALEQILKDKFVPISYVAAQEAYRSILLPLEYSQADYISVKTANKEATRVSFDTTLFGFLLDQNFRYRKSSSGDHYLFGALFYHQALQRELGMRGHRRLGMMRPGIVETYEHQLANMTESEFNGRNYDLRIEETDLFRKARELTRVINPPVMEVIAQGIVDTRELFRALHESNQLSKLFDYTPD